MRLLLIEDAPKLGECLQQGPNKSGFLVDPARDGLEDLHLARRSEKASQHHPSASTMSAKWMTVMNMRPRLSL